MTAKMWRPCRVELPVDALAVHSFSDLVAPFLSELFSKDGGTLDEVGTLIGNYLGWRAIVGTVSSECMEECPGLHIIHNFNGDMTGSAIAEDRQVDLLGNISILDGECSSKIAANGIIGLITHSFCWKVR